mmetsp:Transcript_15997/g.37928  ORF Transcript_15997/g.37928 Transcript_15997/m.37928 type:complete len:246 (+) Transcript_15997:1198-1935(+)
MSTLLPPSGRGGPASSSSSGIGVRGTMVPCQGSVVTLNDPGTTSRSEQMRSTMHGMTSTRPLRSSFRLCTASWSFSQAKSRGLSSTGTLAQFRSSTGPMMSQTLGPMEQLKDVALGISSSHSSPSNVRRMLLSFIMASFIPGKLSFVTTVSPPGRMLSPLTTTSADLSPRSASVSPSNGGLRMEKGTPLPTRPLKTRPKPSFPAPKWMWKPSLEGDMDLCASITEVSERPLLPSDEADEATSGRW